MIKFQKHYVQNTETGKKCRVWYSKGIICIPENGEMVKKECVSIYAKSCLDSMDGVLEGYINDTEIISDYIEKDRIHIFPGDKYYDAVLARV